MQFLLPEGYLVTLGMREPPPVKCGIGVPDGRTLLGCPWVTSTHVKMVDGVAWGEVRSKTAEKLLFHTR